MRSEDLSNPLHELLTRIGALIGANREFRRFLGATPFDDPSASPRKVLTGPCRTLVSSFQLFQSEIMNGFEHREIDIHVWQTLTGVVSELDQAHQFGEVILPHEVGRRALRVEEIIQELRLGNPPAKLPQELMKSVIRDAREVSRLACSYLMRIAIVEAEDACKRLSRAILGRTIEREIRDTRESVYLHDIVKNGVLEHAERAGIKGIRFREDLRAGAGIHVFTDPEKLSRAVSHLFDNAVKYTGKLKDNSRDKYTWIGVRIDQFDGLARLLVESWGVPLTPEELADDLPFTSGYRGFWARYHENNIEGSGSGLYFISEFAGEFGGMLKIETEPVSKPPINLRRRKVPYKKVAVSLSLPFTVQFTERPNAE